jgi:hypothetical protein
MKTVLLVLPESASDTPDIDTFCPGLFQHDGHFVTRRAGGDDIIDNGDMRRYVTPS